MNKGFENIHIALTSLIECKTLKRIREKLLTEFFVLIIDCFLLLIYDFNHMIYKKYNGLPS